MILVFVSVDIGDDPRNGAQDGVGSGCLGKFWVIWFGYVVFDRIGVADIVDDVADRVDCILPKVQIISTVHRTNDL